MLPQRVRLESTSHLVGSPAQNTGSGNEGYSAYLAADIKPEAQHTKGCGGEYNPFGVLASSSVAAAVSGVTRRSEGQSPQAHVTSLLNYSNDPIALSAVADSAFTRSVPSKASNDAEVSGTLVGTRDLQRGLLDQKLHHLQREMDAMRGELKDTTARLTHVTVKLNEQRVEFSALTHRYGAAIEKLTAAENGVKRLEEQLVQERRQHGIVRDERDKVKLSLQELNWEIEKLRRELNEERERPAIDPREVQRMLEDRTRYVPAAELQRRCDEMRDMQQALLTRFATSLDRVLLIHEEDETSVFVARSAVLSAATDLEAKVASAEATLGALYDQLILFNEGSERDMTEMITSLMVENKELWQHLSKLKGDHDAAVTQLETFRRRGDYVPHDQYEYTRKQLALATDKLVRSQKTIEAQMDMAKEHEEQMKIVMSTNESLESKVRCLNEQLTQAQEEADRREQQLGEAKVETKEALRRVDELQSSIESERRQMNNTIQQLNESFLSKEREYEQQLRRLQEERDVTCRDAERVRHDLSDTQQQIKMLQEELESCTQYFESYKQQKEEHQQKVNHSLQEEVAAAREMLEHELSLVRQELESQRAAAREVERERDNELAERRAAQAVAAGLEAEVLQQRHENEQQQRRLEELTAQLQKLEADAEQMRQSCDDAGDEVRQLLREVNQLRERVLELEQLLQQEREANAQQSTQHRKEMREVERSRDMLREEVKKLCLRATEAELEQQQCVPRERTDAEKESLMQENLRLHEQYQKVQQENVALRETVQQLRGRVLNGEQLTQQLNDVQERLRQLPALRQAAEDARREAMRAVEETEALRQERDAMAAKLDFFLEESKQAVKKDEEWGRIIRDAAEQTRRLSGQVLQTKQQQVQRSIPVFTAHPGGYSEQQSNYQRVLGNGTGSMQRKQSSPLRFGVDTSPQPVAPTPQRPWH